MHIIDTESKNHQANIKNFTTQLNNSKHRSREPNSCSDNTMVLYLSAFEFIFVGLDFVGFDERSTQRTCAATNLRRFCAHFGTSPESFTKIFMDLQTTEIDMARIINPFTVHLMMALHWWRTYKIEEEFAGSLEMVEKTARKWIWVYVHAIQGLKEGQEVSAVDHNKTKLRTIGVPFLISFPWYFDTPIIIDYLAL
jgi:hypothetical protein